MSRQTTRRSVRTVLIASAFLLVSAAGQAQVPTWMKDAVIYQIFPERFRNGNTGNDPAGTVAWTSAPTASNYFGGDLQGVIDKINAGYFTDLGVNTIYFNPLFKATSNHAYNTGDYYNIDPRFGNNALFDTLMATANSHGIKIILDGVFNHAGDDSKYMDAYGQWADVGACESATSVYRSWFTTGSQGTCADGWHWNGWAGYSSIPEFAEVDPVKAFFYRGGSPQSPGGVSVVQYWLNKGISGWRFDVAMDISHAWWQDLRPYVKGPFPQAALIGEVWACDTGSGSPSYLQGNELDSNMNYCFRDYAVSYANGGSSSGFNNSYNNLRNVIPSASWYAMMNLLDSHDTVRLLDQLGSNKQRQKLISILQMTLPGAPTVYYGDEVALPGGNDPDDRRGYPWADMGGSPDTNMYAHYKNVIGIRRANSALRGGTLNTLLTDDGQNLYSYIRTDASQKVVVILNNGGSNRTAVVNVSAYVANGAIVTDLLNGNAQYTVSGGNITVPVSSLWGAILRDCPTCTPLPTPTPIPQTPYSGTAFAIPGTIQAENYDVGGEGVAYHDVETANLGGQYRTADAVDIEVTTDAGGGYNVGWTRTDEWIEYTVNVAGAGNYTLTERVASGVATGQFRVEFGGVNKTGTVVVPNTGGFQTWANLTQTVSLSAGTQIMRIYFLGNDANFNYFTLTSNGATATATATARPTATPTARGTATATTRATATSRATATATARSTPTATARPTATSTATATPTTGGINTAAWYQVVNRNSSKCVDASNGGTANDTHVQQWACGTTNAQNWKFTATDSGYYQVGSRNLVTQVWDVAAISTADGGLIHLWSWASGGNQQWQPVSLGGGFYKMVARHDGKCLDVPNASTADGVQLQQWTCNGTNAQSFSLTVVP